MTLHRTYPGIASQCHLKARRISWNKWRKIRLPILEEIGEAFTARQGVWIGAKLGIFAVGPGM